MSESLLPSASIENEFLRVEYLTSQGPRIIGLYAKGVEGNLLAVTPEAHWATPHGEYFLHGGHRLWTAPENPFYTCPEDHVNVLTEDHSVILRSPVDASRLEKQISVRLYANRVILSHRVTWHGRKPIELAPWSITQMRLGGMAVLPQMSSNTGLLPNRKIILWPYARVHDKRFILHDDFILLHGRADEDAFKIGNYNPYGWIAYATRNALLIKRFSTDPDGKYPDMGCNVEAYVKDSCLELETLGPLVTLEPQDFVTFDETWEVHLGDYPATLETAHSISRHLSLK